MDLSPGVDRRLDLGYMLERVVGSQPRSRGKIISDLEERGTKQGVVFIQVLR